jgi:PRTRC genetic system ThiF family protein
MKSLLTLNYDFLEAKPIILPAYDRINFYLIGCGGTGSWLAPSLCRLARTLIEKGKQVRLTFIDPDRVEPANILRQNFCDAEIGSNKAQTLAIRYSLAWGLEIGAIAEQFDSKFIDRYQHYEQALTILIGCVDNAAARGSIAMALQTYPNYFKFNRATFLWWLDCGNHAKSGQVLLGSHLDLDPEVYQFHELGCIRLPAPVLQHPELLVPLPEELSDSNLSCAELAALNAQSLGINQRVATEAAEYLIQLTTGQLKRFATYFDLMSGSARSIYITQRSITRVLENLPKSTIFTN